MATVVPEPPAIHGYTSCTSCLWPLSWLSQAMYITYYVNPYSPNSSTAVTDTTMATISLVILERKTGMASTARALASNRVTNKRWCLFTMRRMRVAYFFCLGLPPLFSTSRDILSRDSRPIVRPDISPGNNIINIRMYSLDCSQKSTSSDR